MVPDEDAPRDEGREENPGTEGSGYCNKCKKWFEDIQKHYSQNAGHDDQRDDGPEE